MTIVNHTTGQQITERALLRLFPTIVAPLILGPDDKWIINPRIGQDGCRAKWDSPPTDEQLRSVGYSTVVIPDQPEPGEGEQIRSGALEFDADADVWRRPWIVEPVPVVVPERVESHLVKIELSAQGLRDPVENLIAQAGQDIKDAWIAPYFDRASVFIEQFRQLLVLTHAEVDQIFINANERQT